MKVLIYYYYSFESIILKNDSNLGIKYVCTWPECQYLNRYLTNILMHIRNHLGKPIIQCNRIGCKRKYKDPRSFGNHLRCHLGLSFVCKDCGEKFDNHSQLMVHRKKHRKNTESDTE